MRTTPNPNPHSNPWPRAAIVALVAAAIAFIGLGSSPLAMSESHRVLPAWDMLARGDFLLTHLFDQPYLRKPPGLVWAIAGASSLLGQTEFAARSVSALAFVLACLLSFLFARRWWGHAAALPAGLAHALTPLFWYPARSAEIESLHNLATQSTLLLLTDALLAPPTRHPWRRAILFSLALTAMLATKGPAGLPALAGVALAAALLTSRRTLLRPALWASLLIPVAAVSVYLWLLAQRVASLDTPPVVQSPSTFLWAADRLWGIATLLPAALLSALPLSVFLIPALLPRIDGPERLFTRTIALGVLLALAFYMLLGVSNPRYAMPALVILPVLVGSAAAWWRLPATQADNGRRTLGHMLLLGHPIYAVIGLLIIAGVYIGMSESRRSRISGRDEGLRFAQSLPPGETLVWADKLIEARPEFFLYAQREAAVHGKSLRVRWMPQDRLAPRLPPPGTMLAIRTDALTIRDDLEPEIETFARVGLPPEQAGEFVGRVHNFTFRIRGIMDSDAPGR